MPIPRAPLRYPFCANEHGVRLVIYGTVLDASCWPRTCSVQASFQVKNCTESPVAFDRYMALAEDGRGNAGFELSEPIVIPPGTSSRGVHFPLVALGDYKLRVLGAPDGPALVLEGDLAVIDGRRDSAIAACAEEHGDWGMHGGMLRTEGCEPIMPDAGKRCHDERDCQGQCDLTRQRSYSRTENMVEGRCSRFTSRFGCGVQIGRTNQGRMPKNVHFARMCVD